MMRFSPQPISEEETNQEYSIRHWCALNNNNQMIPQTTANTKYQTPNSEEEGNGNSKKRISTRKDGNYSKGGTQRCKEEEIFSLTNNKETRKQEIIRWCLLTMDDGIVNWGEHTEAEETNHALMAISSSNEVEQEAQNIAK
ncbi:hypothetical protein Tco_0291738 [Tanacetum coccineum]